MYSCFIAYHGTLGANGTQVIATQFKDTIESLNLRDKPYCGPETDEHTFEEHMTEVIPFSRTFLLVVNDFCPQNDSGVLDNRKVNGGAGYLAAEIEAFRALIKNGKRNVKDFSVYYCGNKRKTYDEKAAYVRRLLSLIDPDETLYFGNNHYLIDLKNIEDWVVLRNNSESIYSDDYIPFPPLEKKVKECVENKKGAILIEMKKGMGKTRFIKHIKNELFPKQTIAIHFSRDEGFSSLGKFRSQFVSQLHENHAEFVYLDDYGALNAKSFAAYLNDFKRESFTENEVMVVCLDSIDDVRPNNNDGSVLDLFSDLSLFDEGIVFVFTAKIPEYGKTYSHIMNRFLNTFSGERISVDDNNGQYLEFLYHYYTRCILTKFDKTDISGVSPKTLFDAFKPKEMLSFSILFRVVSLYLNNNEKPNLDIVKSIETALQFYYSFLKENSTESEEYQRFMYGLIILALSNQPLSLKQIDTIAQECLSVSISDAFLLNKNAVSILVNIIHDEKFGDLYEIRHEKLKELIEKDEENAFTRETLLDAVEMKLDSLAFSDTNLFDFLRENKSCQYLINSYFRNRKNDTRDIEHIQQIADHVSPLSWGELGSDNVDEQAFLLIIVNLKNFANADDLSRAILLTRIAIDETNMAYIFDAHSHAVDAFKLFQPHLNELNDRQMLFYANLLETRCNLSDRTGIREDWLFFINESLRYNKILFEKGFIPLRDYTNVWIASACVTRVVYRDVDQFENTLNQIKVLLDASNDIDIVGQRALWFERHTNVYRDRNQMEEYRKACKECVMVYKDAFDKAPKSFFIGLFYESINEYLDILDNDHITTEEAKVIVKEYLEMIEEVSDKIHFHFPAEKALTYHHIGNLFVRLEDFNTALLYLNKALNEIAEVSKNIADSSDFISKHRRNILATIDKINSIDK